MHFALYTFAVVVVFTPARVLSLSSPSQDSSQIINGMHDLFMKNDATFAKKTRASSVTHKGTHVRTIGLVNRLALTERRQRILHSCLQ